MELYAVRYGEGFKYGNYGSVYRDTETPNQMIAHFTFCFYIARLQGKVVLFDTGFHSEALAENMGINLLDIEDEYKRLLGEENRVNAVVITHSHFDHIGSLDLFPDAGIYISGPAYRAAMEECDEAVKECLLSERTVILNGDTWLEDTFFFQIIGGHSPGSAVVRFSQDGRNYVITGDECYLCANMLDNRPIGITVAPDKNSEFIHKGYLAGDVPLPFHDSEIFVRYPKVSENIVRIC